MASATRRAARRVLLPCRWRSPLQPHAAYVAAIGEVLSLFPNLTTGTVRCWVAGSPGCPRLTDALGRTILAADPAPLAEATARLNQARARCALDAHVLTAEVSGQWQYLKLMKE